MNTAIFDIETTNLYADTGILLCAVVKKFDSRDKPIVIRADSFPLWKKGRRYENNEAVVKATMEALSGPDENQFDLFVAHNGQFFDKTMLTSWALQFRQRPWLRFAKFVDPVMLARRHMRLSRRSLHNLCQFLDIPEKKTDILWKHWMRTMLDGDSASLDYIVEHCIADVTVLEKAYLRVKPLTKEINEKGSSF